jgi:hypothetical protein
LLGVVASHVGADFLGADDDGSTTGVVRLMDIGRWTDW